MDSSTILVVMALVAALGLLGLIAVQTVLIPQQAEAAGCESSVNSGQGTGLIAVNASKGRCFGH